MADILQLKVSTPTESLSQKRIFLFWLPLASSWLLMMSEVPYVSAAIARLPNAQTMIAAFGITTSIAITIESPVIMLLATATALTANRQAYLTLRRFTLHLMVLTTVLHILVGFTPLYDVIVRGWMGIPQAVADAAQPGLQVMCLWSAAIAWRRFKQGVMIRYGSTRLIGVGTIIRLMTSAGTATLLAISGRFSGVTVGGLALLAGALCEVSYSQWASARTINSHVRVDVAGDMAQLTYKDLVKYHAPLAAVSLLTLLGQPLIGAALARADNPEPALAAWPVVYSLLGIFRSLPMALPEAVIALQHNATTQAALRKVCINVGLVTTGGLLVLAITPLGRFYLSGLIGLADNLTGLAIPGILLGVAIPFIMGVQSYWRGMLMWRKATNPVYVAMLINLGALAIALALGVIINIPGVQLAVVALTISLIAEGGYLAWSVQRQAFA